MNHYILESVNTVESYIEWKRLPGISCQFCFEEWFTEFIKIIENYSDDDFIGKYFKNSAFSEFSIYIARKYNLYTESIYPGMKIGVSNFVLGTNNYDLFQCFPGELVINNKYEEELLNFNVKTVKLNENYALVNINELVLSNLVEKKLCKYCNHIGIGRLSSLVLMNKPNSNIAMIRNSLSIVIAESLYDYFHTINSNINFKKIETV